jgi:hypothetical protein
VNRKKNGIGFHNVVHLLENLSQLVLTPIVTICSRFVETGFSYSKLRDCGFMGLKNKSCSKNTLSRLLDGPGFILVEEACINQRAAVYFSFKGTKSRRKEV